jgi:DNA-binding transcriptional MerR regulator
VEFSIQDVAGATGVSSRTLRHYDATGLLPARRRPNGYRAYTRDDLVRLQRILLLRDLGLGLTQIAAVLEGDLDDRAALQQHAAQLRDRVAVLQRQLTSVQRTIAALDDKEEIMPAQMFDGFDNSQYREEVEQRWGGQAWSEGDRWWRGLTDGDRQGFLDEHTAIAAAWAQAREAGLAVDSDEVQRLAARHTAWIGVGWQGRPVTPEALRGLAEVYVADERFAANYGGAEGAQYVRDALVLHAEGL